MVQLPTVVSDIEHRCFAKPLRRVSFADHEHEDDVTAGRLKDSSTGAARAVQLPFSASTKALQINCSEGISSATGSAAAGSGAGAGAVLTAAAGGSARTVRCGHAADQGHRPRMEDSHVIAETLDGLLTVPCPNLSCMLAVFDGHNGAHAAEFASQRILHGVTSSKHFPLDISTSLVEAFMQIDQQYYAALSCAGECAGTTALAALLWGDTLYVANAGDSRAVMSRSGKAIDLTRDHKPHEPGEKQRIESSGGFVCEEGRLNGELGVARAIGDYHLPGLKQPDAGAPCPLIAEPEVKTHLLQEGDEFMLLGCDGLWDVFSSQRAVEFARTRLLQHNDPHRCARELVDEARRMHSADNITVICCCFGDERPKRRVFGGSRYSRSVSRDGLNCLAAALQDQGL